MTKDSKSKTENRTIPVNDNMDRRTFLKRSALAGMAGLAASVAPVNILANTDIPEKQEQFPDLKFNSNGKFKILQLTDTHYVSGDPRSERALKNVAEMLDTERPDLVIHTGDVIFGKPAEGQGDRVMEMEKRHRKFAAVSKAIQPFTAAHEETDCDLLLVGITSTNGALEEARECLEAEGRKVNHIQLRLISPFPAEELRPYIEGAKKVLIVEEDLTAQLREQFAIRFDCHDKLLSLLQYDGTPFLASTIINKSKEVI